MSGSLQGVRVVGRYALHGVLASGGMATVHLGRLQGVQGFSRTVAVKRLHPQYAQDPEFVSMFRDEANLASRIRHPNVVPVIDVVSEGGELLLVMEYVQGETLAKLICRANERGTRIPPRIVAAILCDALDGLHAAHEARDDAGAPLDIVHRDVSPQNIIVGSDGVARVLDFGIAKASNRAQVTREGQLKGKLAYMAPEQLTGTVTRHVDVYAAGVVLWEALVGKRLFFADNEGATIMKILEGQIERPSVVAGTPPEYDAVVLRALATDPAARYANAREMSVALARVAERADPHDVADWLASIADDLLRTRASLVSSMEAVPAALAESPATRADLSSDALVPAAPPAGSRWSLVAAVGIAAAVVAVGVTLLVSRTLSESPRSARVPAVVSAPPRPIDTASSTPTDAPAASTAPIASASPAAPSDAGAPRTNAGTRHAPGKPAPTLSAVKPTKAPLPDFL
jgi:serine/threonine-protein kinase